MSAAGGFAVWAAAVLAGVVTVRLLVATTRDIYASPALQRRNYRGTAVPTASGVLLVLALLPVEAARVTLGAFGVGDRAEENLVRALLLFACFGFGLLGLLDDLLGTEADRGFRGHLRALAEVRLTTGAVKLLGGATVALVVAAAPPGDGGWRVLADAALVALAATLGNLLDRAPGRVIKVALVAYVPLALALGSAPLGLAIAPVVGAALGLLPDDLGERSMLGDTGANVLGAALGVGVVLVAEPEVRTVVLVVLAALNLAAERVSFTSVIDRTAGLRHFDRLGRRPT